MQERGGAITRQRTAGRPRQRRGTDDDGYCSRNGSGRRVVAFGAGESWEWSRSDCRAWKSGPAVAGNDSVVADRADLDSVAGFETLERTPDATAPPVVTPPPVDTSTRPLTIRGGTVKVSKHAATIRVSCPAISPGNCTGSLTLRTARTVRIARHKLALRLGRVHYDLAPGSSSLLRVKLAARTRRLADRKGRLNVLALASTGPAGDIARSSRDLTLACAPRSRGGREQRPTRRPALRRRSWHEIERRSRLLLPRRNRSSTGTPA